MYDTSVCDKHMLSSYIHIKSEVLMVSIFLALTPLALKIENTSYNLRS